MGWKLTEKPKTLKVTKVLAKRFAEMDSCPHDRPFSERRLLVYTRLLKEGQFRPVTWASAFCKETNGLYRVNGKHTSIMLSGLAEMPEFYVTVEEYDCDTLEDVARLYSTFDSGMQSRTARDIYMSFAGTIKELNGLPARTISLAVSGMSYHLNGAVVEGVQPAVKAERLLEYPDFALWLNNIFGHMGRPRSAESRQTSKYIFRSAVVAAMFGTWLKAKGAAEEFWIKVRDETDPRPDMPTRKLAKWLSLTAVDTGSGTVHVKRASEREFYVRSLHAWNAWRKSEPTDLRYHADKDPPSIR
jgi:hypothetical protein